MANGQFDGGNKTAKASDAKKASARESDTLSWMFHTMQKHKLLTHDESVAMFKEYLLGRTVTEDAEGVQTITRTPEAQKIRDRLVVANLRLVVSITKMYRNSGLPMEDLIQEGNIGLMKAVERYDWTKGCRFSTYATWWIKQAIGQHVLKRKKTIRLPAHAAGLQRKMFTAAEEYKKEFNSEPSAEELAELLGTSERIVKATMQSGRQTISLSAPLSSGTEGGDSTVEDTVADTSKDSNPFEAVAEQELMKIARKILLDLSPKESAILRLRYGISESEDNSSEFPVSKDEFNAIISKSQGLQNTEEASK